MRQTGLLMIALMLGNVGHAWAQTASATASPYKLSVAKPGVYQLPRPERDPNRYHFDPNLKTPAQFVGKPYAKEIAAAARASQLDPILVHALIHIESRHQSNAVSEKGAIGLMQVLPETASRFGVNRPQRPHDNLIAGTRYLRTLLDLFDQRLDLALAAYNAGEGAVMKYQRSIPPYAETRAYVPAVLAIYQDWRPTERVQVQYQAGTTLDPEAVAAFNRSSHAEMKRFTFSDCGVSCDPIPEIN